MKKLDLAEQRRLAEYLGITQACISQKLALLELPQESVRAREPVNRNEGGRPVA